METFLDFNKRIVRVGDEVNIIERGYRGFLRGIVLKITKQQAQIQFKEGGLGVTYRDHNRILFIKQGWKSTEVKPSNMSETFPHQTKLLISTNGWGTFIGFWDGREWKSNYATTLNEVVKWKYIHDEF